MARREPVSAPSCHGKEHGALQGAEEMGLLHSPSKCFLPSTAPALPASPQPWTCTGRTGGH